MTTSTIDRATAACCLRSSCFIRTENLAIAARRRRLENRCPEFWSRFDRLSGTVINPYREVPADPATASTLTSRQVSAIPGLVLGLGLFAQRRDREIQPVSQLSMAVAGHHAWVQPQLEQPTVGICDSVNVPEVHTVGDCLGLVDEGFPLVRGLAELAQHRLDEISAPQVAALAATARSRHVVSIVAASDQRQFIVAGA